MSNTANISATSKWTAVLTATSETTGTMSIAGGGQYAVYAGVPPSDLVGHRFTDDLVPFSLNAGEILYVHSRRSGQCVINTD